MDRPELHAIEVGMTRRSAALSVVAAGCLSMSTATAQTPAVPENAQPNDASLSHSALKATTFKVGTALSNLSILSYAVGGGVGGAAYTAFITGTSWAIYTANDYLWDRYSPMKQGTTQPFDAAADVWRNTGKYLTYKPVIATVKLATLYLYTGSPAVALIFGTASIVANTGVFYANNMGWDYYDWYAATTPTVPAEVKPSPVR